ncbi:alpha/beta fold hydrolase [Alloscardovia omnicolens]|uniref:alpha/beta fold hydrolase n=1 Tax=Alloscardovia omnicolens TaxID=419015 RepID=UPI003A75D88A
MAMVELDERATQYGVTFLDDTNDSSYNIGMKGVEAVLEASTREGWVDVATSDDVAGTDFAKMKSAPTPVVAENGNKLHYVHILSRSPQENTPTIVIFPGFTEMIDHFMEIGYYYWQAGFDIYILEHRGQGRSPRDVKNLGLIWIDDFRRYVADAQKFIRSIVRPHSASSFGEKAPVYVYGHSMGGGIAAALAEHDPDLVDKYVLTSPMIAALSPLSAWLTNVSASMGAFFASKKQIFVHPDKQFNTEFDEEFAAGLNHGRALWLHNRRCAVETNQMYAASYNWVKQGLNLNRYIRLRSNEERIHTPMLLFQSEHDAWVSNEQQDAFIADVNNAAEAAGRTAPITKIFMAGARHELEAEKAQTVRDMVVSMLAFLTEGTAQA